MVMVGDGINDATALAAADVGIRLLGARGATASSEAADVVILATVLTELERRSRSPRMRIESLVESIVAGMGPSTLLNARSDCRMARPCCSNSRQEVIDVVVIVNALRRSMRASRTIWVEVNVHCTTDHVPSHALDRLRAIADALDDATPADAAARSGKPRGSVRRGISSRTSVTMRERCIPGWPRFSGTGVSLSAMSRAHREILHLARLLERLTRDLPTENIDRYLIRDAQRIVKSVEQIVRIHTAQEEDIYDAVSRLEILLETRLAAPARVRRYNAVR